MISIIAPVVLFIVKLLETLTADSDSSRIKEEAVKILIGLRLDTNHNLAAHQPSVGCDAVPSTWLILSYF